MEKNLTIEEREAILPWYLKRGWSTFFVFVCAPIELIILLFNLNKMDKETKSDRFFWVVLFGGLWLLNFAPRNLFTIFIAFGFFALSTLLLFMKLLGAEKIK